MDILFSASILAAFFAGMVALFAPCCITVLLPAYLASAFREKSNILKMTFVFFLGISVVLIPIGMGAAGLARIFREFHREMYIVGGALMVIFALLAVSGKGFALIPMTKRVIPKLNALDTQSVFLLGIFSGAATSCCAPVLAGAITLAVVSGVFWKALIVTFAYVFGMTFPLFIAGYFYDRFHIEESKALRGKMFTIHIRGNTFFVHSTNLLAGAVFFVMGGILLALAFSGNAFWAPSFQGDIAYLLNRWSQTIFNVFVGIPDRIWGSIILGVFFFFVYRIGYKGKNPHA